MISFTDDIGLASFIVTQAKLRLVVVHYDTGTGRCMFHFLDHEDRLPLVRGEYLAGAAVPGMQFFATYKQLRSEMTRARRQAVEASSATPEERNT